MISTLLFLLAATLSRHTPHAEASGVAVAKRADGRTEIVLASRAETRVLRSFDLGQSWELVNGDGLERTSPTRVVYYPQGGSRFLIATREGAWSYWNESGVVNQESTGIPEADRYLIDLIAPDPGSQGPAIALSFSGKVFAFWPNQARWKLILDTGVQSSVGALAMSPDFDFLSGQASKRSIYVGHGGKLFASTDVGQNWNLRTDLVADPGGDFHFSALALAKDYSQSGVVLAGLGRDSLSYTGTEGRLLRSSDFGQQYQTIAVNGADPIGSEVTRLLATPDGPDGLRRFFMTLHFFPDSLHFPADPGLLASVDQGLTWSDGGNRQDFYKDGSSNAATGVGRNNLWMTGMGYGPDFQQDGRLWLARGEGVFRSDDIGQHWTRRQIRPTQQVRGISAGLDASGNTVVAAATYGSSIIKYWPHTGQTSLETDTEVLYGEPSESSPNFNLDGSFVVGGRNDVVVGFDFPPPSSKQGWVSINALRSHLDGGTGYVREIALSPNFGLSLGLGFDRSFAWCANVPHSVIGNSRATFDGLNTVHLLHELADPLGAPAPRMFDLEMAAGYVEGNLPPVLDVFGCSKVYEKIYFLRNLGSASQADLKWEAIAYDLDAPVELLYVDPDFQRPNLARIWAVVDGQTVVRLDDLSGDWSQVSELRLPSLPQFEITDFVVLAGPPDKPTIYVLSYGYGVLKLDMSQASWQWQTVGSGYPSLAASSMALDPDFAQNRRIFVGSHAGILVGADQPGVSWQRVNQLALWDETNQGFDFFSPLDPANPDPSRPWGWNRYPRESVSGVDMIGNFLGYTTMDGDYVRFDFEAKRFGVLTLKGPNMADCRIEVFDYDTGALLKTVHQGLTGTQFQNQRVNVFLPQKQRIEIRVYAEIDQPGETFYFDGLIVIE